MGVLSFLGMVARVRVGKVIAYSPVSQQYSVRLRRFKRIFKIGCAIG